MGEEEKERRTGRERKRKRKREEEKKIIWSPNAAFIVESTRSDN